jgi:hypothetical protein
MFRLSKLAKFNSVQRAQNLQSQYAFRAGKVNLRLLSSDLHNSDLDTKSAFNQINPENQTNQTKQTNANSSFIKFINVEKIVAHTPALPSNLSLMENAVRIVAGTAIFPFGFYNVGKNYRGVVEYFGKYYATKDEGLRYNLPFSMKVTNVFVGLRSLNLEKSKVVDKDGNPIVVSAILNYFVEDPIKYVYNVQEIETYLENQASTVIKNISSKYSYDELKNEAEDITNIAVKKIQELVEVCGIRIEILNFNDLSYAPEIAQQMLVKQQAQAHVEARVMIVNSAVSIIEDTLNKLEDLNLDLSAGTKEKIVINLMTVLSSNSGAQNVVNLN